MDQNGYTVRIVVFLSTLVIVWIVYQVKNLIFRKIYTIRKGLDMRFLERVLSAGIVIGGVIIALSSFGGFHTIWKTMLGGTAFISAVLIFAAQDVIKDILGGLMISIYKPFEIGNRIELENGTAGIVKDITMRHVVLQLLDTQVIVIPNSKLNTMSVRNYSYKDTLRSALFVFHIGYDSDVEKALEVVRQAIMDSKYSVPGKMTDHGREYAPVYFMAYEDSSLRLDTTVYYEGISPTEKVITDINLRVSHALKEAGIEIPYAYMNIVQKNKKGT